MSLELLSFCILGSLSLIVGLIMLTRQNSVAAAMNLCLMFICIAGMYGLLDAHFAAVTQLIVYAGAIMVVFVFTIMLLNLPAEELQMSGLTVLEVLICLGSLLLCLAFGTHVGRGLVAQNASQLPIFFSGEYFPHKENLKNIAGLMFTKYLWPFELISVLILIATIGAVVAGKKRDQHD